MELVLTKITQSDWYFFKKLYMDREVIKFISDAMVEEQIKEAFESRLPYWDITSSHWLCYVIRNKDNNAPLGLTGLKMISDTGNRIAEIGYIISPEYAGKSLATKSLAHLLSLPELAGLNDYQAIVTKGNYASERVLKKNGFVLTRIIENNYVIGGVAFDDHIYTLTR